jgi:transposase-like protein
MARDLSRIRLVTLFLDAIYLPVRPSDAKEGVLCARGIAENGERVLLAVSLGMRESEQDWLALGRDLTARGLASPLLVVADGAPGLTNAIEQLWPRSDRQRCTVHRLRIVLAKLPERERERVRLAYWRALDEATDVSDGRRHVGALIAELDRAGYAAAAACLADDLDALLGPPALPAAPPPPLAIDQPARALARRGPPAHQGDRALPRRDELPLALLGGARPRHLHSNAITFHRSRPPGP